MSITHMQKCLLCVQANVLRVLYKHVPCSMYSKHKPQPHSEAKRGRGCSPVGADVQNVAVAKVLGLSESTNTFWHYNSNAIRSAQFVQEPGPDPRRGFGEILLFSFQFQLSVIS